MRLVYEATGEEVQIGDIVEISQGEKCKVKYFRHLINRVLKVKFQ